nr:type ISP restriction/modification enzyme [Actinomyces provencensis]
MTSAGALLDRLYFSATSEREKGDLFERLVRRFLLTDPQYAERFDQVWRWSEWPGHGHRPDRGIDLVARERETGRLCAVQCKFYDPAHQLSKPDIDSFLAESGRMEFDSRLIVSTTEKWNRAAEQTVEEQRVPVSRIGLDYLLDSTVDWDQFDFSTPDVMTLKGRKQLRPHQRTALGHVVEGFETHDRGKLIMACGTGKTFTSLKIAERLAGAGGRVLFLVPSIALLSQSLREWTGESEVPIRSFAVCSDRKVGKGRGGEGEDISVVDLAIPATTDPEALAVALTRPGSSAEGSHPMTVVFATYQSIDVIHRAQGEGGAPGFDLIVCDEAHRTTGATLAGSEESAFVRVHDNAYLRGAKRLYMTATPRIYDDNSKAKAGQKDAVLASMDDEALFGPEFHRLGFGEAVGMGLLTDYRVLVLTVDEGAVSQTMQDTFAVNGELKLPDVARIIGCWNGLAKRGRGGEDNAFEVDPTPMRTAVAFAQDIRTSKRFASTFDHVVRDYVEAARLGGTPIEDPLPASVHHVDGTMNILARNQELDWLKAADDTATDDGVPECRILSNARCLSEGVDVPALDAVIFLNPRKSQVDIVQSVGRVMRLAEGKHYGYIVLPIGIPAGMQPEDVLHDNDRFRVVWEVLQALRAHDERFDAMINKIDLNTTKPDQVAIFDVPVGGDSEGAGDEGGEGLREVQGELALPRLEEWRDAIYARMVTKVGSRRYWEDWAKDVSAIARSHRTRLGTLVEDPQVAPVFEEFLEALRANLNDSVDRAQAIDMLSQHLITKPVFDALFEGYDFTATNPVARVMQRMVTTLEGANLDSETEKLEGFYASVRERASGIDNAAGKQRVITELYEKFFRLAFPLTAQSLGIVYTPIEIVDFILRSADTLLEEHFGVGLTDGGVHVLDPFTGTGTFVVRLLQSGLIKPEDLARKYANELHANEYLLLAYYIAAANIEVAYREVAAQAEIAPGGHEGGYVPFNGIVLTDTFQMSEDGDTLDEAVFTANNDRAHAQNKLDIRVIVANPPYSVGQSSANDNNQNVKYPTLDSHIEATYAARSAAVNKNSLYDSYIRAIRWASDRIKDAGIIGYVTNGGFIDSNTADGLRLTLADEFADIWILNLRGNMRSSNWKAEGGQIFGAGSQATIAITLLVKNPTHTGPARIHYHDIGDYLTREQKLHTIDQANLDTLGWETITPNPEGDWINQRDPRFNTWQPIGGKGSQDGIFQQHTGGLKTNRDAWVYDHSKTKLEDRVRRMIDAYNRHADQRKLPRVLDPKEFSWNRADKTAVTRGTRYQFEPSRVFIGTYRPFDRQYVYFDRRLNDMVYKLYDVFPSSTHHNWGFYLVGTGSAVPFSVLMVNAVPNVHITGAGSGGQFFPRWTWHAVEDLDDSGQAGFDLTGNDDVIVDGYRRTDNITDAALVDYRRQYGPDVTKDDVFHYVYGLLHSPDFRTRFAADLKKQLPRIPLVASASDFRAFVSAGRELADLHMNYEQAAPYPLTITGDSPHGDPYQWYRVEKMRYRGKGAKDKTEITYNAHIAISGIPEEAQEYLLGSRSGLDWILDRYQVRTDKASGIVNDPNDWAREVGSPRYILDLIQRVTMVSVRTMEIVNALPSLEVAR